MNGIIGVAGLMAKTGLSGGSAITCSLSRIRRKACYG